MYKHHSKDDGQSYSIKSIGMRIFDSITQNLIWVERCTAYCYNKKVRTIPFDTDFGIVESFALL